jgi:STIP1 family protein 1
MAALDPRAAAEALKGEGNACWTRGDAAGAEAAYSRGISAIGSRPPAPLVSLLSTLHSNRALSRKAQSDWGGTEADASTACELDRFNWKAANLLGQALQRRGEHDGAVASFQRALDKAGRVAGGGAGLVGDLEASLARAKAAGAEAARERAQARDDELNSFLTTLIDEHAVRCVRSGDAASAAAAAHHSTALSALFAEREKGRQRCELPDAMACAISMEAFLDPVCTPSGNSFERAAIVSALQRKPEDPISRTPLTVHNLVPNHALRNVVAWYLETHPEDHPLVSGGKEGGGT